MMPDWDWMQWKAVVDAPMSVEVWEWPYRVQDFLVFICLPRSDCLGSPDWLDTPVLSLESYSRGNNENNLVSIRPGDTVIQTSLGSSWSIIMKCQYPSTPPVKDILPYKSKVP